MTTWSVYSANEQQQTTANPKQKPFYHATQEILKMPFFFSFSLLLIRFVDFILREDESTKRNFFNTDPKCLIGQMTVFVYFKTIIYDSLILWFWTSS